MKFAFFTLGCKVNLFETQALSQLAQARGHEIVDKDADAVIVNTCTVTSVSDHKNIRAFHKLRRDNPNAVIAACGCFAQTDPERVRATGEIDLICGTRDRAQVIDLCEQAVSGQAVQVHESEDSGFETLPAGIPHGRTRALLKIEDGCNNFCTYCIVPYVRGRERSRRPEEIEKELRELVAAGYKEITLLGQNVNSYGKDLGIDVDFADLLRRLNAVPGDFWLRFMTSHPKDASPKLFSAMAECDKVAKQLHLPFQSGSDEILHRMNRRYTAEHYKSLIADARSKMPDITLSSDIIVGFPGETDEDFEQTLKLVQDTRFDLLFTFLYSPRTGTPAASYEDNATPQDKQRRFERLLKAQDEIVAEKQAAYQGRKLRLLVDGNAKGPEYPFTARTEGNLLVCVRGDDIKIGEFIEAEIEKTSLRCLFAHKL